VKQDPWQRWSPLAGIAFAVLWIVALGVSGGPGDTPTEVSSYYADSGNRAREFFVFFLVVAAVLALLWFLGALRAILVRVEGEPARWTALAFGAGLTSATLMLGAAALFVASAGAAGQSEFRFDPHTWNLISNAGYALLVCSVMTAGLVVLATSIVALRTPVLPRWAALTGFVVAPVLLFAIFFFPLFVWLGWVLVVSVLVLLRTARVADWRRPSV
jgi:hypothetical protein